MLVLQTWGDICLDFTVIFCVYSGYRAGISGIVTEHGAMDSDPARSNRQIEKSYDITKSIGLNDR